MLWLSLLLCVLIVVVDKGATNQEYFNQYGYPYYNNYPYAQLPQRFPGNVTGLPRYNTGFYPNYQPQPQSPQPYSGVNAIPPYPYKIAIPNRDCFLKGRVIPCSSLSNDGPNEKVEIIDVSPEYHQKLLGFYPNRVQDIRSRTSQNPYVSPRQSTTYTTNQVVSRPVLQRRPKYQVYIDTTNNTYIPQTITYKPIIRTKSFNSTIKRTFVYDPNRPQKPINLTFINGELVTEKATTITPLDSDELTDEEEDEKDTSTTTEIATTTENEDAPSAVTNWSIW